MVSLSSVREQHRPVLRIYREGNGWQRRGQSEMNGYDHRRAVQILGAVLAVAVVSSIVHYTDNYVNYADYPQPTDGAPNPSQNLVLVSWFVFTAAALAGYLLF